MASSSKISSVVDSSQYPELHRFVRDWIDMQLADIRDLMKLPSGEIKAGMNLTTTSALCGVIAGSSVLLYNASVESLDGKRNNRGQKFKAVVREYFPCSSEEIGPEKLAEVLYDLSRNPLAHSFALPSTGLKEYAIFLKDVQSEDSLQLLDQYERPDGLPRVIFVKPMGDTGRTAYVMYVRSLYWGVRRMLTDLLSDPRQCMQSEVVVKKVNANMDQIAEVLNKGI